MNTGVGLAPQRGTDDSGGQPVTRHKGRRRLFAARRSIFPRHCSCGGAHFRPTVAMSLMDWHVTRTVAPR